MRPADSYHIDEPIRISPFDESSHQRIGEVNERISGPDEGIVLSNLSLVDEGEPKQGHEEVKGGDGKHKGGMGR